MNPAALRIHGADTVATALRNLVAGEVVLGVTLSDAIPRAHKFALVAHAPGDPVLKFGFPIGQATAGIAPGDHVHVHNVATALAGEAAYGGGAGIERGHAPGSGLKCRG